MSTKIEKSMRVKLAATTAVTTLVSTRIYYGNAVQGASFPYIVLNRISTDGIGVSAGQNASKTTNVRMQVDLWDDDYEGTKNLADAVRAALFGWTDPTADPSVGSCLLIDESDDLESPATGGTRPLYRVSQDYSVWYAD